MGQIQNKCAQFLRSEDGATTVDYVVGVAAGVALALSLMNAIGDGTKQHAAQVEDKFEEVGIRTY